VRVLPDTLRRAEALHQLERLAEIDDDARGSRLRAGVGDVDKRCDDCNPDTRGRDESDPQRNAATGHEGGQYSFAPDVLDACRSAKGVGRDYETFR
jgi:hypothetical protein